MPKYDSARFDPPAPVAEVALRNSASGTTVADVPLLLDTGADITLLPRTTVQRLGLKPISGTDYQLIGFDGSKSAADAVDLDMIFLGKAYRGRYLLIDDEYGVLGRDVLSGVVLLLNGPRQEWSEQP